MHKKTIFVSGATDGIGKATALELAAMGHKLLLHGRDTEKGAALVDLIRRETKNEDLSFFCADFESLHAVNEMANEVLKDNQRLDVLINNAGGFYKRRQLTKDGYEMTFSVNHLAPALLTMQLLDLLKASAPARVVHVASTAHNGVRSVDFEDLQYPILKRTHATIGGQWCIFQRAAPGCD
jgi:NAD(P)-dependent dehydrogenase (short-subunit alcohol dehydrogenase family)